MKDTVMMLVQWAAAHAHLAGPVVAAVACIESLAFVGMLVPGTVVILGAGALIGIGVLDFRIIFAWAAGGAVLGDGVSYWLGKRYQEQLSRVRYLRRRPGLLARGEAFFRRHGGKSILLARFVGPMRPVVPVVAGILAVPPWRFVLYDIPSALAWAAFHLLIGMAFGASLALAGEVAARLALGLVLLTLLVVAVVWGARAIHRQFQPHARAWTALLLHWGRRHRRLTWLVGDLLDPARPVSRPLLLWLVLLIAASWLFFGVLEDVVTLDPLVYAGQAFYHLLQQLRTPTGDRIMTLFTEAGDVAVAAPVTLAVFAWLLWRRRWRDAWYWLAAVGCGALAVIAIKAALHMPRPVAIYAGIDAYSFPSGHTTLSTVIYGFLAVLAAPSFVPRRRWMPYALASLLVAGIACSRLYLGAHWLADVVAGIGLGTAWVALLAIARARHRGSHERIRALPQLTLAVFAAALAWHAHAAFRTDLARYAVRVPVQQMDAAQWWASAWRQLPAYRLDLEGERQQPLNVQWAGTLQQLRQTLAAAGWRTPLRLGARTALRWLLPHPALVDLPVTPQLHDGRDEALVMVHERRGRADQQWVVRLWPTAVTLRRGAVPLWVGTVALLRVERLPLVSFVRTGGGYDRGLAQLQALLPLRHRRVRRAVPKGAEKSSWSGATLMVDAVPAVKAHPQGAGTGRGFAPRPARHRLVVTQQKTTGTAPSARRPRSLAGVSR